MEKDKKDEPNDQENKLTFEQILAYDPSDENKSSEIQQLNKLTAAMMKEHCEDKSNALTYGQIRNILQEIKNNKKNIATSVPKLVYMEAKQEKSKQKMLIRFIRELLEQSIENNKVHIFREYLETLVAYHKFYSSSKNNQNDTEV